MESSQKKLLQTSATSLSRPWACVPVVVLVRTLADGLSLLSFVVWRTLCLFDFLCVLCFHDGFCFILCPVFLDLPFCTHLFFAGCAGCTTNVWLRLGCSKIVSDALAAPHLWVRLGCSVVGVLLWPFLCSVGSLLGPLSRVLILPLRVCVALPFVCCCSLRVSCRLRHVFLALSPAAVLTFLFFSFCFVGACVGRCSVGLALVVLCFSSLWSCCCVRLLLLALSRVKNSNIPRSS